MKPMHTPHTVIVGGGLAGCECAWQLASRGHGVRLIEMKPRRFSPAHTLDGLAELVCSNSLRSAETSTAIGLLKEEMTQIGSLLMDAAEATRVPAGKALAVDRSLFSQWITTRLEEHPAVEIVRAEVASLDDPLLAGAERVVIAAGPLASEPLAESLGRAIGAEGLYFYDAIAPIVTADSLDMEHVFAASRWAEPAAPGEAVEADYLNCPLDKDEYHAFLEALKNARTVPCREFEKHFEGCLPIEEMAARGDMTLAFGPMKPVGLTDPRTGRRPFAVVQLRAENRERSRYNLVGFQTKLAHPEQQRVFGLIPGLQHAEYERLGSIHRNTYVNAPQVLSDHLELRVRPGIHLAGQITGVEGYVESAACGLWLGLHLAGRQAGREIPPPPRESMIGALLAHLRTPAKDFQPSNVAFGLTPTLEGKAGKVRRKELYAARSRAAFGGWLAAQLGSGH